MSKVGKDVALSSLKEFLSIHLKKEASQGKLTEQYIEDEYGDVLYAVMEGNLVFDQYEKPIYTLFEPIKNDEGEDSVTTVNFRSRIKGADKTVLMNGIDPKKQLGDYMIKVISYMTQTNQSLIKKLEKDDYDVLNQLCSVF